MRVLFIDYCNGFESDNPNVTLVDVFNTEERVMKALEGSQIGVGRVGGSWRKIMKDGNIQHVVVQSGKHNELVSENHDLCYELITGNY